MRGIRRHFTDILLINCNSKSRSLRNLHMPILVREYARIRYIIQQIIPLVIMNPQTLFLNDCIVGCGVNLQTSSKCNRAERAMRRYCNIISLRHREYFFTLCNAACMR